MYPKGGKRLLDLAAATLLLALLWPVLLALMLWLAVTAGGNPFFRQKRPGKNGRIFGVLKLRTMNDRRGPTGELLPDSQRLTPIGRWLRKTSLDELPQLWNVLRGDMSLVGPRPLLVEYLPLYSDRQRRRHEVRPGITGWAQVNGRNALAWTAKFEHDIWYVENLSLKTDLLILGLTLRKVLRAEGVNADSSTTMERFSGNF
ncbi:sugar transferase [Tellurirhabdus rosea]|uniref:sugar transferase n=1 Tax=Tellurirhabdus rosea TaxID=2674997 RepID=UPI002251742C|nr:sugar transferase [Tellurirhabdus rosea]